MRFQKITPTVFLFLFLGLTGMAQNRFTISGTVVDSTGAPLPGATVVLLQQKDSVLVSFGITESDGRFEIRRAPADDYLLQINNFFATRGLPAYIRPLGEANRCLNAWAAVNCDGTQRGGGVGGEERVSRAGGEDHHPPLLHVAHGAAADIGLGDRGDRQRRLHAGDVRRGAHRDHGLVARAPGEPDDRAEADHGRQQHRRDDEALRPFEARPDAAQLRRELVEEGSHVSARRISPKTSTTSPTRPPSCCAPRATG